MYDNSYLNPKSRCNGFISRPYIPEVKSKGKKKPPKKVLKIENQVPVEIKKEFLHNTLIESKDKSYTVEALALELNVTKAIIKKAVDGFKSVTIDGIDYKITRTRFLVDVYHHGILKAKNQTNKQASDLIGCASTYVSQLKIKKYTTASGWSVKASEVAE